MTTETDISNALKKGQDAVKQLAAWQAKWKAAEEAGGDLNQIQKALLDVPGLGKAGAALGLAVAVIGLFSDKGPSDTQLILDAIAKLSDQVTQLQVNMDRGFEKQERHADLIAAKANMHSHTEKLAEINDALRNFRENCGKGGVAGEAVSARSDEGTLQALDDDCRSFIQPLLTERRAPSVLSDAVLDISEHLSKADPSENLLEAIYRDTCGDRQEVVAVGARLLRLAIWSAHAYATIARIRYEADPSGGLPTEAAIDKVFTPKIEAIAAGINRQLEKPIPPMIEDKLEMDVFPNLDLREVPGGDGYLKAAEKVERVLRAQWPQYDFLTIVYWPFPGSWDPKPYQDPDYAGVTFGGSIDVRPYYQQHCKDGYQANIIVAWSDKRTSPADGTVSDVIEIVNATSHRDSLINVTDFPPAVDYLNTDYDPGPASTPVKNSQAYLDLMATSHSNAPDKVGNDSSLLWLLRRGEPHWFGFAATSPARVHLIGDVGALSHRAQWKHALGSRGQATGRWNAIYYT